MSESNDKSSRLIDKAFDHFKAKEKEQAQACVDELLAADPDHLDGHILAGYLLPFDSDESMEHFKFVIDRDIAHAEPLALYRETTGFTEVFLFGLQMRLLNNNQEKERRELSDLILDYSTRLLAAGRKITSIHSFAEIMLDRDLFDDVIDLGKYFIGDATAEEIGRPGLRLVHDNHILGEITPLVMNAFFLSERHEDGCRWIFQCVLKKPDKGYPWYLLGEALCCLGYPEETARAWIISTEKGGYSMETAEEFDALVHLVHDPENPEKEEMYLRLLSMKEQIPPEKKESYEDLSKALFRSTRNDDEPALTVKHIEDKLGMKLPARKSTRNSYRRRQRLFLPGKKSAAPVVQEVMALMDKQFGSDSPDTASAVSQKPGSPKERARAKVAVGADTGPGREGLTLLQFGIDLTERARRGEIPPIVGRDREIERMVRILVRYEKNNPILLGEAGVGKTAVVQGLAQRIASGRVPASLTDRRIIELNVGVLVAVTTYRGDFEKRMTDIVKETRDDPHIILFIDELHTLIGAGDSKGGLDAANILKPALSSGDLSLIGATTAREFSRSIEKDPALERRFSPVWLHEIDRETTLAALLARKPLWQKYHDVQIDDDILRSAVQLTDQHVRHRHFPDKAIDLIDEACALARTTAASPDRGSLAVTGEHVKRVVDEWTGAAADARGLPPVGYIDEIRLQLGRHIVGHDRLLDRLGALVVDEKLGLRLSKLPRVLYFWGKPNTGKTESARALSQVLWPGEKERFLFINMGRYEDPADLNSLIGAPPGYAGSEESGILPRHLKQFPYSVIYLYNFHKAHPQVMRLFVDLFKEGSFPDAAGQTVFTGNALFILSATVDDDRRGMGFGPASVEFSQDRPPGDGELVTFLEREGVPKEIAHVAKDVFRFDTLSEEEIRVLFLRRLESTVKQPYLRDFDIKIDETLIDDLVRRYTQSPSASRDLQGLLNRFAYPFFRRKLTAGSCSSE